MANSIIGKVYKETSSTVGIANMEVKVQHVQRSTSSGGGGEDGDIEVEFWTTCEKPEKV